MIPLIRVELTRMRRRRAVLVLLAAAIVLPSLVAITTVWSTRPYSESERAEARDKAMAMGGFEQDLAWCEKRPKRFGVDDAAECEEMLISQFSASPRYPLDLIEQLSDSGVAVATVLVMLLLLVGATFAGADWSSGAMSNHLLFEPRRLRVWSAKAIVVGAVAGLVAFVVLSSYWLILYAVSSARGLEQPPSVVEEMAWMVARCSALAGLAAVGGYALTMLVRSTVFTLGATFAVAVLGSFIAAFGIGGRWMPSTNVTAVMRGFATYYVEPPEVCGVTDPRDWDAAMVRTCSGEQWVSVWEGLVVVVVPTLIVVILSVWSFKNRDVP